MRISWLPYFGPATDAGGGTPDLRASMRAAIAAATGGSAEVADTRPDEDEGDDAGAGAAEEDAGESDADEGEADEDEDDADDTRERRDRGAADEDAEGEGDGEDEEAEEGEPEPEKFLSDAEIKALQKKHKGDPGALSKALQAAFTKKTQRLAAERSQYARAREFAPFIEAFDEDPMEAIRILGRMNGLDLKQLAAAGEGKVEEPTVEEPKPAPTLAEFDFDQEKWGAAIATWAKDEAKREIRAELKPVRERTEAIATTQMLARTDEVMRGFTERHPDWHDHEDAILALSTELAPTPRMTEDRYLDLLYDHVTRAQREESIRKGERGRLKKTLERVSTAEPGEARSRAVPDNRVRKVAPKSFNLRDAANAALRGEVWEDDDE
jgi:hypothetical protein